MENERKVLLINTTNKQYKHNTVEYVLPHSTNVIIRDVSSMLSQLCPDLLVVSLHWHDNIESCVFCINTSDAYK